MEFKTALYNSVEPSESITTNPLCSPLNAEWIGKLGDWSLINGRSEPEQKLELKLDCAGCPIPIITTYSYPSSCKSFWKSDNCPNILVQPAHPWVVK